MSDLYSQFLETSALTIPCALQANAEVVDPETGLTRAVLAPGSKPMFFDLRHLTPDENLAADAVLNAAKPPPTFHEENRAGTVGSSKIQDGYDWDHPDYIAARQKLLPKRNAYVCLYGCPALMESTPGDTVEAKAQHLMKSISTFIVQWIASRLDNLGMFTGVGEEEVNLFLAGKSGGASSSAGSSSAKAPGKRTRSSNASTGRRSTTKSAKRRGTGK